MIAGLDKLTLAAKFAPDLLLDNRNPEEVAKRVFAATGGVGADFVICAVPTAAVQGQALELSRKRGVVVIYGGVPKSAENTVLNSNLIHYNEITVTGAFSYPATGLSDALSAIKAGHIRPEKYITSEIPLDDVVSGIEAVRAGTALKVMLKP
jgi:L-iditol 2-dehydrogenase